MKLEIDNVLLVNPKFDLIGWYVNYLNETGIFHREYQKLHELHYKPIPCGEEDELVDLPGLVDWENDKPNIFDFERNQSWNSDDDDEILGRIANTLNECTPFPGDGEVVDLTYQPRESRFTVS